MQGPSITQEAMVTKDNKKEQRAMTSAKILFLDFSWSTNNYTKQIEGKSITEASHYNIIRRIAYSAVAVISSAGISAGSSLKQQIFNQLTNTDQYTRISNNSTMQICVECNKL